jgi:hypothetical protein
MFVSGANVKSEAFAAATKNIGRAERIAFRIEAIYPKISDVE